MKRTLLTAMLMVAVVFGTMAQPAGKGQRGQFKQENECLGIPDLTEQQTQQIEKLKVEHLKKMNTMKAEMEKLRAEKQALMIADNPDKKAIDAVIDKMGTLRTAMQKEKTQHHLAVRALLTDEQKVFFDQRTAQHRKGKGMHNRDRGPGYGYRGHCDAPAKGN